MKLSQVLKSRESWKSIAKERRLANVALRRKLSSLQQKILLLQAQRDSLLGELATSKVTEGLQQSFEPMTKIELRIFCVLMFSWAHISFNAIVRVLALLNKQQKLRFNWVPHPSSVVNWVARCGLGMLQEVNFSSAPWVAMIDSSISYGKDKMLICLRVPLNHFLLNKCAVSLRHAECVGLFIRGSWNGDDVGTALLQIFAKVGTPAFILKDQGPDLKAGVNFLKQSFPEIQTLRDIGHVAALLLKKSYAENNVYLKFLKLVEVARARLCHSEFGFLRPPKIRSKGRFQSVSRLMDWAEKMLQVTAGAGGIKRGSMRAKLREAIPGLRGMRFFFMRFSRDCNTVNKFLCVVKNEGLNQITAQACQKILEELPKKSKIRVGLEDWLAETLDLQGELSIGQTPLVVSTDCLESLFGVTKSIIERMPSPEFGTLALATPLFCGSLKAQKIEAAMQRCSQKQLTNWKLEHIQNTKRRAKKRILASIQQNSVQELRSACGP